jgi:hypothetical protein
LSPRAAEDERRAAGLRAVDLRVVDFRRVDAAFDLEPARDLDLEPPDLAAIPTS